MNDKINAVVQEFIELKKADEDFDGNEAMEAKIKKLITKVEGEI